MSGHKESFWIPYADLMTLLMVIFLFISLSYMGLVQFQKKQQDKIFQEYKETKENLYSELNETFKDDFQKWSLELDKDLSIKFTNPNVLFQSGSSEISPVFKQILSDFFPRYLGVILQDKYKDKISEVRIEGHTDDVPVGQSNDPYMENVQLSQNRSRNVLGYVRSLASYKSLKSDKEQLLQFWLTANGLSYGRTLDSNKALTYYSRNSIDKEKSRRVEFRIVTSSENLVQKVIEQLAN